MCAYCLVTKFCCKVVYNKLCIIIISLVITSYNFKFTGAKVICHYWSRRTHVCYRKAHNLNPREYIQDEQEHRQNPRPPQLMSLPQISIAMPHNLTEAFPGEQGL